MERIALHWVPQGTFHHVGFVVSSIAETVERFRQAIEGEWDGEIILDPHQSVRVSFLRGKNPADPLLELIEPEGDHSPVLSFLKRGGGIHHVCYLVECLETELAACPARGMLVVRPPLPAAAFGNRRIAWVCTSDKFLIEYLER